MAYDYRTGTQVNPSAPADSLERKQAYVDNGTAIAPPSRYHSSEFMAREWQWLWPKAWLIAGVSSDLPEIGAYCLFEIGSESIIVSR